MTMLSLRREISEGESGLSGVPKHVTMLIERDMWQTRIVCQTGEQVHFERFEEFVEAEPLEGLYTDMRILKNLCRDDKAALDALDKVMVGRQGERNDLRDNAGEARGRASYGTSSTYALRKLRKDRPDLHARVLDKEDPLTPHAAMIEAGFRKKTFMAPEDLQGLARVLVKRGIDRDELYKAMKEAVDNSTRVVHVKSGEPYDVYIGRAYSGRGRVQASRQASGRTPLKKVRTGPAKKQ